MLEPLTHNLCFDPETRKICVKLYTQVLLYKSGVQVGIHFIDTKHQKCKLLIYLPESSEFVKKKFCRSQYYAFIYKEFSDFCFLTDHMAVTETVDIVQYSQRDVYIPHDYERGISHVT